MCGKGFRAGAPKVGAPQGGVKSRIPVTRTLLDVGPAPTCTPPPALHVQDHTNHGRLQRQGPGPADTPATSVGLNQGFHVESIGQ